LKLLKTMAYSGLFLLFALTFIGCSKEASSSAYPEVVTFGTQKLAEDFMIAIHEGIIEDYFAEKGVKCEFVDFSSGAAANVALASESIDFALVGTSPLTTAASIGLDLQLIWTHVIVGDGEALCVKNDSGIKSVEDLAGRRIAVPVGSTSHLVCLRALEAAGIEDQVTILDMNPQDIVAAWTRGNIEAAYVWNPALGELKKDGTILKTAADLIETGLPTVDVQVVRTEFAEKYPELVDLYIAAMIDAGNIRRNSLDDAAEILADQLGIDVDVARRQIEGNIWLTPEEALAPSLFGTSEAPGNLVQVCKDTADFLLEQGQIDNAPDLEYFKKVVQPKYIENAIEIVNSRK
jgi:taurine transport system substrate-binding protein